MEITTQPMTAEESATLAAFVDRVVVPSLVERFLSEHNVRRPDAKAPLAKPKDAA